MSGPSGSAPAAGSWGELSLEIPPPFLDPIIDGINTFLEVFVTLLDIAMVVLNIVKVFIMGLVGPILAIIDALIALIESLVMDLRQAGFFTRGDWSLLDQDFKLWSKEIRGGYNKFEGRVFEWFTDTTDPGRPDISTASGVFGVFLYLQVDLSQIEALIKAIMSICKFFKAITSTNPIPIPSGLKSEYWVSWGELFDFAVPAEKLPDFVGQDIERVSLTWDYASVSSITIPFSLGDPKGCLVEVSTVPELLVGWSERPAGATPRSASDGDPDEVKLRKSFYSAPPSHGGGVLKLYGGVERLMGGPCDQVLGSPTRHAWVVTNPRDTNVISVKEWKTANPQGLQRTFYADKGLFDNNIELSKDHMPYALKSVDREGKPTFEDEPASTVFVRVTGLSKDGYEHIKDLIPGGGIGSQPTASTDDGEGIRWDLPATGAYPCSPKRGGVVDLSVLGTPSEPLIMPLPSETFMKFQEMVMAAVCIALATRPDLDGNMGTGDTTLAPVSESLFNMLSTGGWEASGKFFKSGSCVGRAFRRKCRYIAKDILEEWSKKAGGVSDGVYDALVEAHYDVLCGNDSGRDKFGLALISDLVASEATGGADVATGVATADTEESEVAALEITGTGAQYLGLPARNYKNTSILELFKDEGKMFRVEKSLASKGGVWFAGGSTQVAVHTNLQKSIESNRLSGNHVTACRDNAGDYTAIPYVILTVGIGGGPDTYMGCNTALDTIKDRAAFEAAFVEGKFAAIPFRNMISSDGYASAAAILGVAAKAIKMKNGEWHFFRPFGNMMEPVEEVFKMILLFLRNVREGLAAAVERIMAFIRMIEARIMEIQGIIRKIQALLAMLKDISVEGAFSMLLVNSAGTQGLLSDFMTAENKPSGGSGSYGMGMVAVAGGWPLILVELISALIDGGGGEE